MNNLDKRDMPLYIIILSLIFVFPLGIYFLVLKKENHLLKLKKCIKILKFIGLVGLTFIIIYFIANFNHYLSLIDSHMNIDMYNFNFIYIYIISIMITVSCLVGSSYLNKKCEKLVIYTEFINVRHIKDINLISEETEESIDEVKDTINKLIDTGHLINVKLVNDHIVSTKTVDKNISNRLVRCKSCGNVKSLEKDTVRCDFCFRKLNKKDKINL